MGPATQQVLGLLLPFKLSSANSTSICNKKLTHCSPTAHSGVLCHDCACRPQLCVTQKQWEYPLCARPSTSPCQRISPRALHYPALPAFPASPSPCSLMATTLTHRSGVALDEAPLQDSGVLVLGQAGSAVLPPSPFPWPVPIHLLCLSCNDISAGELPGSNQYPLLCAKDSPLWLSSHFSQSCYVYF